ncbi:MAG: helix-turn-helix domain-containing protein [Chitinophagaceae bacterium]
MELVNEYIFLNISVDANINASFCETSQNQDYLFVNFGLYAKDCLFDLTVNNYLFNIRISKTYFEKYNETFDITAQQQAICCNTQTKLLEVANCTLSGIHKKLFLESAILFLLFQVQKNSLVSQIGCNTCAILNKPTELEKMHAAKNYIIENLSSNLTIPIISTAVGTNQCYLKKGFKEVFSQTIFEFIQENRMIKAKYLLESNPQNITDVAFAVGYASLSSFSQAYKNYFGISPLEYSKQN